MADSLKESDKEKIIRIRGNSLKRNGRSAKLTYYLCSKKENREIGEELTALRGLIILGVEVI